MKLNSHINDKQLSEDVVRALQKNGIDHYTVYFKKAKNKIKLPPNIMVFQSFAYLAATKLKPSSNCVLMLLFSLSAYENHIAMDVLTIAEILEYDKRSVIKALKELVKNHIVVKTKHPNDRRRNDYFINPTAAWKGNSYTRKKAMTLLDKNQLILFAEPIVWPSKEIS